MACSATFNKQIMHTFSILDLTNFNVKMLGHKTRSLVQYVSKIAQDYYPEQLGQLMIVALMLATASMLRACNVSARDQQLFVCGGATLLSLVMALERVPW